MSRPQTAPAAPPALAGVAGVHNALALEGLLGGGAARASALTIGSLCTGYGGGDHHA